MNMKQATYWEAQERRWHEKYIELEGMTDKLETRIWELENALRNVSEINNKRDQNIDAIIAKVLGGAND